MASLIDPPPTPGTSLVVLSPAQPEAVVESSTRRAAVIAATMGGRAAVKAVQKGGTVHLPGPAVTPPKVTDLVQHIVRLVSPRRINLLRADNGRLAWSAEPSEVLTSAKTLHP